MFRRFIARHSWLNRLFGRKRKSRDDRRERFQAEIRRHMRHESLEQRTMLNGISLTYGGPVPVASSVSDLRQQPIGVGLGRLAEDFTAFTSTNPSVAYVNPDVSLVGNSVYLDIVAQSDSQSLATDLAALGMSNVAIAGSIISGLMPIGSIPGLNTLSGVNSINPAASFTNVGLTTSQGDPSMQSDLVSMAPVRESACYRIATTTWGELLPTLHRAICPALEIHAAM